MCNKRKVMFLSLILLISTLFISCDTTPTRRVYFTEGWKYSLSTTKEFKPLQEEYLKNLEQLVPGGSGYIYLSYDFFVPYQLKGLDLGFYLGRITIADETYLNGVMIGKTGRTPPYEFSAWNTARYYHCDTGILTNGKNTLLIKIYVDGEGSVVSDPFLGTAADAQKQAGIESFWNAKIHLLCAFFMIIISMYHFLLWFKRRKDKENLLFAIINVVLAFYLSVFYLQELPVISSQRISFLWFQKVFSCAMPFLFPLMVTDFINEFLKHKDKLWVRITRYVFAVVPIIIILSIPNYPMLRRVRVYVQAALIPPMMYMLFLLISQKVKKAKNINHLLFGFSPLVIIFMADLFLHNVLHYYDLPYISTYGWMFVVLSLLFMLAGRFADSRNVAESMNEILEKKVADRTKALSESNLRLEEADRIAKKDMKLAVYVQQSFYPKKAPDVDGWDISYIFKPSSGVSGDLYDFYTAGSKLKGISLFDVSGHGIAAGLVTMLAKTIISQQFESRYDEKLSSVMTAVSEHVAAAKGDIENYLTGILLRIKGDYVTYVNGGHPSMLYQGANGAVQTVAVPGKQPQGPIVGISGLGGTYENLSIMMKKGDALILFTDCLTESKNADGEMFGEKRIMESLKAQTGKSAQEKLVALQASLKEFVGEKPLNDDLTVIILQKK